MPDVGALRRDLAVADRKSNRTIEREWIRGRHAPWWADDYEAEDEDGFALMYDPDRSALIVNPIEEPEGPGGDGDNW